MQHGLFKAARGMWTRDGLHIHGPSFLLPAHLSFFVTVLQSPP